MTLELSGLIKRDRQVGTLLIAEGKSRRHSGRTNQHKMVTARVWRALMVIAGKVQTIAEADQEVREARPNICFLHDSLIKSYACWRSCLFPEVLTKDFTAAHISDIRDR